ncbi:MAG: hypothetical protein JSU01_17255 [Bacteroidetes bacterium]|nr:hypothetical protein [Bacteroidota bacterium]
MKLFLPTVILLFAAICLTTSCKKEKPVQPPVSASTRTLRFILYTNENFSGNNYDISFSLHISDGMSAPFDSTVFTAKVKDIPDKAHQLVFEKRIPYGKTVTAGFVYAIKDVGYSWHLDTCAANEKFKVIEYPFQ